MLIASESAPSSCNLPPVRHRLHEVGLFERLTQAFRARHGDRNLTPASPDDSSPADETPAHDSAADTLQFVQEQQAIEQANEAAQPQTNAALAARSQPQ
jgi:hypothetical protein